MANCNQPLADMSEFLRVEQGDGEINQQQDRKSERDYSHRDPLAYLNFWQALT